MSGPLESTLAPATGSVAGNRTHIDNVLTGGPAGFEAGSCQLFKKSVYYHSNGV